MTNLPGHTIGRYKILEPLGKGGMATVYKAFDTELEREVAIKFIRSERLDDEHGDMMLKRFKREARLLAKLAHPNILTLLDYGEYEGQFFLVTNLIPGWSLKERLVKPMPWQEAARLLIPIARALEYAHSQNVLHRDIKPSNILLSTGGEPILADFGIAKVLEGKPVRDPAAPTDTDLGSGTDSDLGPLTRTEVGIGTPEYVAPEQARGSADRRSDVYSLGIVFYEMVTGRKPFVADTPLAVLLMQITDPLPPPRQFAPDLPVEVERIIIKALEKSPDNRYQDMGAFAEAISQTTTNYETGLRASALESEKAERWEEASQAWHDVLDFAPADRETIEAQLERLQLLKGLTSLYIEAGQAVAKKDYDSAIRLLRKIIEEDQTYKDAASLLTQAIKMRQARVLNLEKEEKWDEALLVWRDQLADEPENQEFIESEIQRIEMKRDLANWYREARSAIHEKDYARASKLLKDIIARDETYKDVLQLLANVNAKRRLTGQGFLRRYRWTVLSIFTAAACICLAVALSSNPAVKNPMATFVASLFGAPPTETPVSPNSISNPPIAEQTTPTTAEQIRAFADPFLAEIANTTPAYQDDFSDPTSGWPSGTQTNLGPSGLGTGERGYIDGQYFLRASLLPPDRCCLDSLASDQEEIPVFYDFVMSADIQFAAGEAGAWAVSFRRTYGDPPGAWHYVVNLSTSGHYEIIKTDMSTSETLASGQASFFKKGRAANQLEIVAEGTRMAFFLNDEPLQLVEDGTASQGTIVLSMAGDTDAPLEVRYDNLKIWDISGMPIGALTPFSTAAPNQKVRNPANQHSYLFVKTEKFWNQARDYCASLGSHLVTIEDAKEDEFVYQLTSGTGKTWLGATDELKEGTWVWVTGETWQYTHWDEGEPNNSNGSENYLAYHHDLNDPRWNDQGNDLLFFTCEWDVPETAEMTTPTATLDPNIQAALNEVMSKPPRYEASFDDWGIWQPHGNVKLKNGLLIADDQDLSGTSARVNVLRSDKFAVSFDFRIQKIKYDTSGCGFSVADMSFDNNLANGLGFDFGEGFTSASIFGPSASYPWEKIISAPGGMFDPSSFNTATIIVLGDQITTLINNRMGYSTSDSRVDRVYKSHQLIASSGAVCEFDNYKLWDLRESAP